LFVGDGAADKYPRPVLHYFQQPPGGDRAEVGEVGAQELDRVRPG
jgi:hypothetical protein